ncbi:hypothetical protein SDC9_192629 [bioreactor metagenome]|uniref:Uncharacterized protein n=1 Tax=bioreactor metagenome TaxID=1076179 RepID=A0A645I2S4_9ZZZZ
MLKKVSPCIAKGTQVEENMGEHDFFGNALTDTHNIGCYEGTGVDGENVQTSFVDYIKGMINSYIDIVLNILIEQVNHDINWLNNQLGIKLPFVENKYE